MRTYSRLFRLSRLLRPFSVALAALSLTSCADIYYNGAGVLAGRTQYLEGYDPGDARYRGQKIDTESWWRGDGVQGPSRVVISLSEQKAFFYKAGHLVGVSAVSSGDSNHGTPAGRYAITQKDMYHKSSQYGDYVDYAGNVIMENVDRQVDPAPPGATFDGAKMYYFMRFTRGIGMHAGYLPGYPASHGCVRMPKQMAEAFFRNVSVGTPVEVRY